MSAAGVEAVVASPQGVGRGREQSNPLPDPLRAGSSPSCSRPIVALQQRVQRVQLVEGGHIDLVEARHARVAAPVHAVQHQAVKVDFEVGGGHEAPDRSDGASAPSVSLELCAARHMARDHALHTCSTREAPSGCVASCKRRGERHRQHPLPHWNVRDDMVHQVGGSLRHPPGAA